MFSIQTLVPGEGIRLRSTFRFAPLRATADRSNPIFLLVPEVGLEPTSLAAHDFESCVFTNFTTPAYFLKY